MDVPPASWVDDMRTPTPDVVLAEFHRQKGLLAAAAALASSEQHSPQAAAAADGDSASGEEGQGGAVHEDKEEDYFDIDVGPGGWPRIPCRAVGGFISRQESRRLGM